MAVPEGVAAAIRDKSCGSVVAPAGYGKTETIADIVAASAGRCLLLTHTLAGVDALKKRLAEKGVRADRYQLDTIAAWSLRYAASFPVTSGLKGITTPRGGDWPAVYSAAIKLLRSRTVDVVLAASYKLALVDEYQDCSLDQHEIIADLALVVPTIVFGDPLQSIFAIGGEEVVNWSDDVLPIFPCVEKLSTPWRWQNKGNHKLAKWLHRLRMDLEAGKPVTFADAPACVRVHHQKDSSMAQSLEKRACNKVVPSPTNRVAIIGSKESEAKRAALAKRVRAQTVETIECKELQTTCTKIEDNSGLPRLRHLINLLHKCLVGVRPTTFLRRIEDIHMGKIKPRALSLRESAALEVLKSDRLEPLITLIEAFRRAGQVFRGELLFALKDSLQARLVSNDMSLLECAWHVQERRRHAGRRHGYKIVTSTLLVKGLEFENAVVFLFHPMTKEDVYVALTRASRRIEIVTERLSFQPK